MRADDLPQNTRVNTIYGPGKVVYVRLAPPLYREVEAVSVYLDGVTRMGYAGTMMSVDKVEKCNV